MYLFTLDFLYQPYRLNHTWFKISGKALQWYCLFS